MNLRIPKTLTKKVMKKYLKIQKEGIYNMFLEAHLVSSLVGLNMNDYFKLLDNYAKLIKKFDLGK